MLEKLPERFRKRVDSTGDCWLWTGGFYTTGYGSYFHDGKKLKAHRYAWSFFNGPITDGLFVCHRCDVRNCVNPEHLFLGTQKDNIKDMYAKNRGNKPSGENHFKAKLDWEKVKEIRDSYKWFSCDNSSFALGKKYGVAPNHIMQIVNNKAWKVVDEK
ncbi:HNH endonuclease signature motif containing protein [Paenibacillus sp. LjRoot56]|uniref:HNH endonuclease signature motif containing protein n=1 Tax=Paenibacillus sp. LjRoot56 TaxID=3342333 RepID=UPI003ED06451